MVVVSARAPVRPHARTFLQLFYLAILAIGIWSLSYTKCKGELNCIKLLWAGKLSLRGVVQAYMRALDRNPILVKSLTSFVLFGISDAMAQLISERAFCWLRVFWFAVWGALSAAPAMHYWYKALEEVFAPQKWHRIAAMAFIDQAIFTPLYTITYFVYDGVTKGKGIVRGLHRFQNEGRKVVFFTWCFWLPANLCNFSFVPLDLRVLYVSTLAILWNMYFSYITQRKVGNVTTSQIEHSEHPNSKAAV